MPGSPVSCRRRASGSKVEPWSRVDTSTAKKTMLKNSKPFRPCDHRERSQARRERRPRRPPQERTNPLARRRTHSPGRRHEHRHRAGDEDEDQGEHGSLECDPPELRREDEEAEHQEHRHLRQPGEPLVEDGDRPLAGDGPAPQSPDRRGRRRGSPTRAAPRRHRMRSPPCLRVAIGYAASAPRRTRRSPSIAQPARRPTRPPAPMPSSLREEYAPCRETPYPGVLDPVDEPDHQQDRQGIVEPGLALERESDPPAQR